MADENIDNESYADVLGNVDWESISSTDWDETPEEEDNDTPTYNEDVILAESDEGEDDDDGNVGDDAGEYLGEDDEESDEPFDYLSEDESVVDAIDPNDESASPYMEEDLPDLIEYDSTSTDDGYGEDEDEADDGYFSGDEPTDVEREDEDSDEDEVVVELAEQQDETEDYDISDDEEDFVDDDMGLYLVSDDEEIEAEQDYLEEDELVADETDPSGEDVIELDYNSPENPYTVECDCICAVKTGDRVMVQLVNGEPTVIGVVGWGDALQSDVDAAKGSAKEAHDAAIAAQEDADAANASAEAAEIAASSAISQASVAESAANDALSQAGIASTSAANAGRAAALAQAALNTMGDYDWDSEDFNQDASLFYKDELGAHIVDARGADGKYRTDINSSGMEVTEIATGNSVASFGAGGARVGTEDKAHTNISRNMFSIIGDDGNPTFQAEKGIVVIGNPYDNVQRFSADGFGFYKYTGTTTKWKQINTESDSSYTLVYIKSGTAWAEDDCLNVEITGYVQIPLPSDGDPSLTEVNPLVLEIDGEQVLVNAEIGRPKHVVENGARRTQWDIAWRYATNKSVSVSLFSEDQLGELFKFSKPVSGGYIFESIRAYLLKPTYEKTFSVSSDGSVETKLLYVLGDIATGNSFKVISGQYIDPEDGLGSVDEGAQEVVFEADKNGNVTATGNVTAGRLFAAVCDNSQVESGLDTGYAAERTGTFGDGTEARRTVYGVGSGGKNAGVWDSNQGFWQIYSNGSSGRVGIRGTAAVVDADGIYSGLKGSAIITESISLFSSVSIAAGGYESGTVNLASRHSGYKPIAVVGQYVNSRYVGFGQAYIDDDDVLHYLVHNNTSSARSTSASLKIIFVR